MLTKSNKHHRLTLKRSIIEEFILINPMKLWNECDNRLLANKNIEILKCKLTKISDCSSSLFIEKNIINSWYKVHYLLCFDFFSYTSYEFYITCQKLNEKKKKKKHSSFKILKFYIFSFKLKD